MADIVKLSIKDETCYPLSIPEALVDPEDNKPLSDVLPNIKDKKYDSTKYSGMGRKYLKKNIIDGVNVLEQDMISEANTIYIIQYDYDLQGQTITIPEGCILDFQGGSFSNGEIAGLNISLYGYSKFTDVYMNISGDISCHNIFFNYIHHLSKACFIINNANKVVIDKVRIETLENLYPYLSAPAGCGGINIYNSSNIHIYNCYIKNTEERNTSEENAYIHAPIMLKSSHNILIENCHIENSPTEYIALWDSCSNAKVINCICENTRGGETTYGNSAIATTGPDGDIFIDNVIAKNVGASGFSLNCKNVTIINSAVENNKDAHGVTLGHNMENGRVERAFVSNCVIKIDNPTADQFGIYNEGTNNSELIILNCKIQNYRRAVGTSANNTRIENVTYKYPIEKFNVLGGSFFCEHLLRSSDNTRIKIDNCTGETCYNIINFKELPKDYSYNVAITNSSFITYVGLQIYNTNRLSSNKENTFICKGNTINSINDNSTFVFYDTSKLRYIIENNIINTSKYLIEQVSPPNDITGFDSVYSINSNIINTTFKDKTLFYFEYSEKENKPCLLFNNNYVNVNSSGNDFQNMTTIINNNNNNLT